MSFLQELDISRVTKLSDDLERRVNLLDRLVDEDVLGVKHLVGHRCALLLDERGVVAHYHGLGCSLDLCLSENIPIEG